MTGFTARGTLVVQDSSIDNKSFVVDVECFRKMSIYSEGYAKDINIVIKNTKSHKRVSGKNLLKDIKNFICPIAGSKEASLVRKRLINLQKIHKSISDQSFNFAIR